MIYVIEIPHQLPPRAWAARDRAELIARVYAHADQTGSSTIYETTTVQELRDQHGDCEGCEECELIQQLADRYGTETTLYRADYAHAEGEYSDCEISEYDAVIAYLSSDLHSLKIFESDEEAREALANRSEWEMHQGTRAQESLRDLLS